MSKSTRSNSKTRLLHEKANDRIVPEADASGSLRRMGQSARHE
jgi:hypothetical protein